MKNGEKRNFIYMPSIGWIEAGATPDNAMERIRYAEVELEIENKKLLRRIKKKFPNSRIRKEGSAWIIDQPEEPG
ncbi:hypothetical protein [Bacillus benzoevorans]|uniref:Uncharacterized protein n=1 Tax=Bacillus benzoevorans TaxID=1456 RepID=A0A7X0HSR4_9BACI|nr:hypothetical protein [Bacillus benzoevorans]MBB6446175.1 hypothetical protein [Bacillus benzoevorans]